MPTDQAPHLLDYASPRRANGDNRWPWEAAIANTCGQLFAFVAGVAIGEARLGLPAHEDGWQADVHIAFVVGPCAAMVGSCVFLIAGKYSRIRNIPAALSAGCLNGLVLAVLHSVTNIASDRLSNVLACVGLGLFLLGPLLGAKCCAHFRRGVVR